MQEITFLSIEQIFGEKRLEIIKKYGTRCAITDFAILLDGFVLNNYHVLGGFSLKDRTGCWMTKSSYDDDCAYIVDHRGYKDFSNNLKRQNGVRPVLLCNFLSDYFKISSNEIIEFEYGEYPQSVVNEIFSRKLETAYINDELIPTGKTYITDSARSEINSSAHFMARGHVEYEYNGEKYIRINVQNSYCNGSILSDGRIIHSGNVYWVHVEPVRWILDLKNKLALSKNILFSGLQYNNYNNINHNFIDTDIYAFLNTIFLKDLIPSFSSRKGLSKVKSFY